MERRSRTSVEDVNVVHFFDGTDMSRAPQTRPIPSWIDEPMSISLKMMIKWHQLRYRTSEVGSIDQPFSNLVVCRLCRFSLAPTKASPSHEVQMTLASTRRRCRRRLLCTVEDMNVVHFWTAKICHVHHKPSASPARSTIRWVDH